MEREVLTDLLKHVMDAGFPLEPDTIVHLFIGGSQLHGAKVSGYDDLDIYGCYIEPPQCILGVRPVEHFVWSSSMGGKNTAADVDVIMYSLHRWAQLLMKGNPAILHFLFADPVWPDDPRPWRSMVSWRTIRDHRHLFITKKAAHQYLGFANAQRMRLTGERGMGRHGQRPDLVEKYGFDTKFAMHYIRLLLECRELLRDRTLTFPRPERELLIDIRTGKYNLNEVFDTGRMLSSECEELLAKSPLQEQVDANVLSKIVSEVYLQHWSIFENGS